MRIAGNRPNSCGGPTSISIFYKVVGVGPYSTKKAVVIAPARTIGNDGVGNVENATVVINAAAAYCCRIARKGGIEDGDGTAAGVVDAASMIRCGIA